MSKIRTKIKKYSLSIAVDNQKTKLICRAPTKAQFILHELVPQISLFSNYEKKIIHTYLNQGKWKIILKSKKIWENAYLKGNVVSLFKNEIFSDLKP